MARALGLVERCSCGRTDISVAVLIPEGYHPVSSPPGYTAYYLNILAGSAQSLANYEDPEHVSVKETYAGQDPRVPVYDVRKR
jgi:5-deoxy-glucuronate isomerase